jgi:hypothetical protein
MKLAHLFKPRKLKKKPDPWFFGWGSTDAPGEAHVAEAEVKVHRRQDLPQRVHLAKSFYMVLNPSTSIWPTYTVRQLLNETPVADVTMFEVPNTNEHSWTFEPNEAFFPNYAGDDFEVLVRPSDLHNVLKLKWWVTNKLIELGALPPKEK